VSQLIPHIQVIGRWWKSINALLQSETAIPCIWKLCWAHYAPTSLPFFLLISPLHKAHFTLNFLSFLNQCCRIGLWQWNHFWTNIYMLLDVEVLDPIDFQLNYHNGLWYWLHFFSPYEVLIHPFHLFALTQCAYAVHLISVKSYTCIIAWVNQSESRIVYEWGIR